jgi:hypothetical protein
LRTPVVLAAALLAALQGTASAGVVPSVVLHKCEIEATNGTAECLVVLDANPDGGFGTTTWSGWGSADLLCKVSAAHFHFEGDEGSDFRAWNHGADVCTLVVQASGGATDGYVF